jgi:hypothetical protein
MGKITGMAARVALDRHGMAMLRKREELRPRQGPGGTWEQCQAGLRPPPSEQESWLVMALSPPSTRVTLDETGIYAGKVNLNVVLLF